MRCDISSARLGFLLCRTSVVAARVVIIQDITNVELLGVRKDWYGDIQVHISVMSLLRHHINVGILSVMGGKGVPKHRHVTRVIAFLWDGSSLGTKESELGRRNGGPTVTIL